MIRDSTIELIKSKLEELDSRGVTLVYWYILNYLGEKERKHE